MLANLAFWYQVIIASEQLLEDAISWLRGDGWEGEIRSFFAKHLQDEKHHAKWLKEDLGEYPIVLHYGAAQLAGMAYYLIRHLHPVSLLGYMIALESKPISMEYVEAAEKRYGASAVRTLRLHAEVDQIHAEELRLAVEMVPREWRPLVENTRVQTLKLLEHPQ